MLSTVGQDVTRFELCMFCGDSHNKREGRRISAQEGRPRLDSWRPPASAVWKSELVRASGTASRTLSRVPGTACWSDCLPGSAADAVAQGPGPSRAQAVGTETLNRYDIGTKNLGDVDRTSTHDFNTGSWAP